MPRSGTTWVGRVIERSPTAFYVHEPFNISGQFCRCGVRIDSWFYYVTAGNRPLIRNHLSHVIYPAFSRIGLLNAVSALGRNRQIRPFIRYLNSFTSSRPVIKDPLAVFSAEQLVDLFDTSTVIIVRHPAAVASSYKSLNWDHPFSHFLNQPELMENQLAPFRAETELVSCRSQSDSRSC